MHYQMVMIHPAWGLVVREQTRKLILRLPFSALAPGSS